MRAIAAACLALGLALSACTGDAEPRSAPSASSEGPSTTPSESPTPSPSPSPSGTTLTAAVPKPPPATQNRRGRVAFAEYVLQAWIYALNTNDPSPLLDVSGPKPCDGCGDLARELKRRERAGWHVGLEDVGVGEPTVAVTGKTTRVVIPVTVPESATYHEDGSFRSANPPHPGRKFEVVMTYAGKKYRLELFSFF